MDKTYAAIILGLAQGYALAQAGRIVPPASEVQMVLTVEAREGEKVPELTRDDVIVFQDLQRERVLSWTRCRAENVGVEIFILIDDAANPTIASQFQDIEDFVKAQPSSVAIGIGYMRNGLVEMVQPLTGNRGSAVAKLRLPMGGSGASPYLSLSDLVRQWPESSACRNVLIVTPGVAAFDLGGEGFHNIFVDAAIRDAQRRGVVVHALYALGAGHAGHALGLNWMARHYLAQITAETGGAAYSLSFGAPVSLAPYLSDLSQRMANQYLMTASATPGEKSGYRSVEIRSEAPGIKLTAPARVYVEAR